VTHPPPAIAALLRLAAALGLGGSSALAALAAFFSARASFLAAAASHFSSAAFAFAAVAAIAVAWVPCWKKAVQIVQSNAATHRLHEVGGRDALAVGVGEQVKAVEWFSGAVPRAV